MSLAIGLFIVVVGDTRHSRLVTHTYTHTHGRTGKARVLRVFLGSAARIHARWHYTRNIKPIRKQYGSVDMSACMCFGWGGGVEVGGGVSRRARAMCIIIGT